MTINTIDTMFIGATDEKGLVLLNIIVALKDIEIIQTKETNKFTIKLSKVVSDLQAADEITVCISDDPDMANAFDWTQMGSSRLRYTFKNCKRIKDEFFTFSFTFFQLDTLLPERCFPDDVYSDFRFW